MLEPDWPYCITIHEPNWVDVEQWCNDYIGQFDQDWYKLGIDPAESLITNNIHTTWYFKNQKDIILFELKWA